MGGQMVMDGILTWGGERTIYVQMTYYRIVHLKPM